MAIRMKPTSYGPVFVRAAEDGSLRYGTSAAQISGTEPLSSSPADTLLAAIGACMVLSIGIIAGRNKTELGPFHVEVRAVKSEHPPSHFGQYEVKISAGLTNDPEVSADIAKRAKAICTISNSLNGDVVLAVGT